MQIYQVAAGHPTTPSSLRSDLRDGVEQTRNEARLAFAVIRSVLDPRVSKELHTQVNATARHERHLLVPPRVAPPPDGTPCASTSTVADLIPGESRWAETWGRICFAARDEPFLAPWVSLGQAIGGAMLA